LRLRHHVKLTLLSETHTTDGMSLIDCHIEAPCIQRVQSNIQYAFVTLNYDPVEK